MQREEIGSGHINICDLKYESGCWNRMLEKDGEITSQEILLCGQTKGRFARVLWVVSDVLGAFTSILDVQQKECPVISCSYIELEGGRDGSAVIRSWGKWRRCWLGEVEIVIFVRKGSETLIRITFLDQL